MSLPIPHSEIEALAKTYGWSHLSVVAYGEEEGPAQVVSCTNGECDSRRIARDAAVMVFPDRPSAESFRVFRDTVFPKDKELEGSK